MFHKRNNGQEDGTAYQEEKIKELRAAIGPLSGNSLKFCTDSCLRRYLKARNWNVVKSKSMLEETLKWRSSYKPEEIRWVNRVLISSRPIVGEVFLDRHEVEKEGTTGKAYRANFCDRDGRTVVVMRPGKQNTKSHDGQIQHMVYLMENVILSLAEGQEQIVWLVDFTGWSFRNSVPVKTSRESMDIMQNHYPERLFAAFLYNPPRIFEAFWKVCKLFLDPLTFEKMKFVYPNPKNGESIEVMRKHFDLDILPEEFGGKKKIEYDHNEYSKLMISDDVKMARAWRLEEKSTKETCDKSITI